MGYIYLITNKISGKQYVGQTIQKVKQRWIQHICDSKSGRQYPLYRAINKYGRNNFKIVILAVVDSIDKLNELEAYFISDMKTIVPNGYNVRTGGGNSRLHESTKKKISKARMGKTSAPHTEEFKKNLSKRNIGNKYSLGRKQSIEERDKHRVISKNYKRGSKGKFVKKV